MSWSYYSPLEDWTDFYNALNEAINPVPARPVFWRAFEAKMKGIDVKMERMAHLIKEQRADTHQFFSNLKQEEDQDFDFDAFSGPNTRESTCEYSYNPRPHHTKIEEDEEEEEEQECERYEKLVLKMMMGDVITTLNEMNLDEQTRVKVNKIYSEKISKVRSAKMRRNIPDQRRCTSICKTGIRCKNPMCELDPGETKCYTHFTDDQKERHRRVKAARFCEKHEDIIRDFI